MKILGDYHTHTKYSKFNHGKNTIFEMVDRAEKIGLSEIAITDHGPRHLVGIIPWKIKKARREIDEINKTSKVKVYLGMECNFLNFKGKTDLPKKYADLIDIKIVGMHRALFINPFTYFNFVFKNVRDKSGKYVEKNTDAYIKALEKYKFNFISHPQEYVKVNLKRLSKYCEEHNVYLELNNRHFRYTRKEIEMLVHETNVKFIVSSDAHNIFALGHVENALKKVNEYNIPVDRIVNIEKLPDFKRN